MDINDHLVEDSEQHFLVCLFIMVDLINHYLQGSSSSVSSESK